MKNLGERLQKIADLIEPCGVLADIGSDHGLLPAYLLKKGVAGYAVITDISAKSLTKAQSLIASEGLSERAEFFCADGIISISRQPDTVVIAGMGGREIADILSDALVSGETYLFQPMKNAAHLREFLSRNGFKIITDVKVKESEKFYDIIKAVNGADSLTKEEILFGRTNLIEKSACFMEYLDFEISKTIDLMIELENNPARYKDLFIYLKQLKKLRG
jgi:tRNA (adenine22-N1)-methyltransferase